ncbi:hypothetical protein L486_05762 [Kwoniella mangroviensis CBS 10435]|uniref:Protein kinase domain-containing protein n=1 Tax=Kwoniella mangroviensis CBS 10435 TaxID=1331196 RepID=A0A1B9IMS7_9TREE|nr:hypothetical protein L486_05762 [Kwoniella mangroviensis CBS 10435]
MTQNDDIEDPYIEQAPPDWPLCDSWITNTRGGIMIHNNTFYEVQRVPNTLSDRLMGEDDFGILPPTTAPGFLIIGDKVEELTSVQVRAKKREVVEKGEVVENADGNLVHSQGLEDTRLAIESEEFKSLPIVKVDPATHHVKLPRSLREVKNLITVRAVPYLIQLVGRTEEGRVVTLRYGQDLTSWNMGPFVDGAKVQLPQEWKYQWVVDIVLALQNLHKLGILHGDLTTNNV